MHLTPRSDKTMHLTPKQLDNQSLIRIDRWIDVDSVECRKLDDNYKLTKRIIRDLYEQEPASLFTDSLGRFWDKGVNGIYFPYHFEYGKKLIGYRMSKKAAN
jgi:hypothetical protein